MATEATRPVRQCVSRRPSPPAASLPQLGKVDSAACVTTAGFELVRTQFEQQDGEPGGAQGRAAGHPGGAGVTRPDSSARARRNLQCPRGVGAYRGSCAGRWVRAWCVSECADLSAWRAHPGRPEASAVSREPGLERADSRVPGVQPLQAHAVRLHA